MELDSDCVHLLAFSRDGSSIVSASGCTLRLWRTSTAELEYIMLDSRQARCVEFSPCGRCVVSGSNGYAVHVWSAITGGGRNPF